jgi:nucleotide-binding universal stress UspA family protein
MKILFAGDEHPYSAYALNEVVRLATNTWADVTLVAVSPAEAGAKVGEDHTLARALHQYRETFLASAGGEGSPYALGTWRYEWLPLKGGQWEELLVNRGAKKDVKVHLRVGNEAQEVLAEAREEESDLIVLGCTKGKQCIWRGAAPTPQKVVNDADCSVLLVKEEQPWR